MSEQPAYPAPQQRDPRREPRAGDVLIPRSGHTMEVTYVDRLNEVIILRPMPGSGRVTAWNLTTYLRLAGGGWGVHKTHKFSYEA